MLTELEVLGSVAGSPVLGLSSAGITQDPIIIKDIQGLGAVKADVRTSPVGGSNREYLTGASYGKRNIVITYGLNPDWATQTVESLRTLLYTYFMPTQPVELRFASTHLPTVRILGTVESMEPNIFSADPEVIVSIICPEPNFKAITPTTVTGIVANSLSQAPQKVVYQGSLPTGFNLKITRDFAPTMLTGQTLSIITKSPYSKTFQTVAYADATKIHLMRSVYGQKYVKTLDTSTNVETNLLYSVPLDAEWPVLRPGDNMVLVYAQDRQGFVWEMTYTAEYGGL